MSELVYTIEGGTRGLYFADLAPLLSGLAHQLD